MLKYVVLLAIAVCLVGSQRPPYAGSSNRYPVVLPRFREEQENATIASASSDIGNRIGSGNTNSVAYNPVRPVVTSTIPPDLPVDAHGDIELINRIKTWPREKQPFWYINWQQIQEHRGDNKQHQQQPQQQQQQSW